MESKHQPHRTLLCRTINLCAPPPPLITGQRWLLQSLVREQEFSDRRTQRVLFRGSVPPPDHPHAPPRSGAPDRRPAGPPPQLCLLRRAGAAPPQGVPRGDRPPPEPPLPLRAPPVPGSEGRGLVRGGGRMAFGVPEKFNNLAAAGKRLQSPAGFGGQSQPVFAGVPFAGSWSCKIVAINSKGPVEHKIRLGIIIFILACRCKQFLLPGLWGMRSALIKKGCPCKKCQGGIVLVWLFSQ